ncbi:hypothetical protein PGT21_033161 [Puccinia graminis f. sp. tritici]|uniref:Uncharacterized protein n=1 Tax=Puccinia graminis f. sp. tritici TaxID=56615 RepID=A0A5B0QCB3_PUCGR|nr:hypothetical protein PGT21_033161 [Puccinia graminis f. sp. tritici]
MASPFKFFLPRLVSKTATCTQKPAQQRPVAGEGHPWKHRRLVQLPGALGVPLLQPPGSTGGTTKAGTAGGTTNTRPGTTGSTEKAAEKDKTKTENPKGSLVKYRN